MFVLTILLSVLGQSGTGGSGLFVPQNAFDQFILDYGPYVGGFALFVFFGFVVTKKFFKPSSSSNVYTTEVVDTTTTEGRSNGVSPTGTNLTMSPSTRHGDNSIVIETATHFININTGESVQKNANDLWADKQIEIRRKRRFRNQGPVSDEEADQLTLF